MLKPIRAEAAADLAIPGSIVDGHEPDGEKALSLQAFSRALVPTPNDWTDEKLAVRLLADGAEPGLSSSCGSCRLSGNGTCPPIYIGFGSMPSADPRKLTDTVLTALKTTGQRAIIATGWGGLVKDALPDDVVDRIFLLEKAPHSWLFPRCTAIVHHGGAGTTHEAIRWGKPSLVCPVFGDQPFWGARVHEIGAGPKPIRQKSLTADKLAQALRTLEDPSYRAKAQRAAEIMTREPSAKGTAERLMQLLAGRQGSKPARQKAGCVLLLMRSHLRRSFLFLRSLTQLPLQAARGVARQCSQPAITSSSCVLFPPLSVLF
ncbi:glycosyltransferase [Roseibium salinum]|nr:glycosyltransferase [Roseibium salinum]